MLLLELLGEIELLKGKILNKWARILFFGKKKNRKSDTPFST